LPIVHCLLSAALSFIIHHESEVNMTRRTAGKRAREIGLVMLVLGLASGAYFTAVLKGTLFGASDVHGETIMTWPDIVPPLLISGTAMIVLIVAGLLTWIFGSRTDRT
jgi:vacuolar-type H+-ATPase subunit I/STV1